MVKYLYRQPSMLNRGTVYHINGEAQETLLVSVVDAANNPVPYTKEDFVTGKTILVRSAWRPNAVAAYNISSSVVITIKPVGRRDQPLDANVWQIQVTELSPTVEFFNGEPVLLEIV